MGTGVDVALRVGARALRWFAVGLVLLGVAAFGIAFNDQVVVEDPELATAASQARWWGMLLSMLPLSAGTLGLVADWAWRRQ